MNIVEKIKRLRKETDISVSEDKKIIELYPDILLKSHKEKMKIIDKERKRNH